MTVTIPTFANNLRDQLNRIASMVEELVDKSTIRDRRSEYDKLAQIGVCVALPSFAWGPPTAPQQALQRQILTLWPHWGSAMQFLFEEDSKTNQKSLADAVKELGIWIEREGPDHSVPETLSKAREVLRTKVASLENLLQPFVDSAKTTIIVPDTNVLLENPALESYGKDLGTDAYEIWLVPGVLQEMDSHKVNHKGEGVREKALKFTQRLKGWRTQGSLQSGVKVQGKIFVHADGVEPDFSRSLPWLDRDVMDDRILASVLELQRRFPGAAVALASNDTNMLVKADATFVPTVDISASPSSGEPRR